jgi:Cu/Ag efflux protein CusF
MRIGIMLCMTVILALSMGLSACARNAVEKRAASPTMGERIKQDSVTGKVSDIGTRHVSIRNNDGELHRIRVDDQTKMDQVAIGDQVKAYVSDEGYASTIQRVNP